MANETEIQWADATFNPWSGCTKVSPACEHCYAEVNYSVKMRGVKWGKYGNRIVAADSMWSQPLLWNRKAAAGVCRRCNGTGFVAKGSTAACPVCLGSGHVKPYRLKVFCASLADVFEGNDTMPNEYWPEVRAARWRLLKLIKDTPQLDWLLLTKRPELVMAAVANAARIVPGDDTDQDEYICWAANWVAGKAPDNVWIGTTVENQEWANKRIPKLLTIPAAVRFLSVEPILGPIEFSNVTRRSDVISQLGKPALDGIGWVIVGGESGSKARPMHPYWVRSIRDQCRAVDVPFFFKQWGEWAEVQKEVPNRVASPRMVQSGDAVITTDGRIALVGENLGCRLEGQGLPMRKVGKKEAGRELDGRTWDEMPEVHS